MTEQRVIFWVYEAFYIEAMIACVKSALDSAELISSAYGGKESNLTETQFLDCFQNIIQQAAAISRYFWPSPSHRSKHIELHRRRGALLRAALKVGDDNPLKYRNLRNRIEHFDENLDIYLQQPVAGSFIPAYVGPSTPPEAPSHYLRAFFTDVGVFEVLGERYAMQPLYDELDRLHALLLECMSNGYRLLRVPDA